MNSTLAASNARRTAKSLAAVIDVSLMSSFFGEDAAAPCGQGNAKFGAARPAVTRSRLPAGCGKRRADWAGGGRNDRH